MLLRELIGGDLPRACKLILIDDPTGFGHRVTDGDWVLEHVLTKAPEFERAVAEKVAEGFVETERSLTRRVFATADRFWIVWLDGDTVGSQSGGIRADWRESSGQVKGREYRYCAGRWRRTTRPSRTSGRRATARCTGGR